MSFEENHATFFDDVNLKELELPANQSVPTNQRRSSEYNQQLVFKLAWSTRNAIMISLIRYTEVLRGVEKADVKDQLKKINTKLYQVMLDLPLKSDTDAQARSGHSSSVSLDLDFGTKSQIAAAMLANHNLVLYPESASEESKTKMIKKNNDLVIKLIKLPFSVTPNPADEVALRDNIHKLTDRCSELAKEVARLNKMIEDKETELFAKAAEHTEETTRLNQIIENKEAELIKQAVTNCDLSKKIGELEKAAQVRERADMPNEVVGSSSGQVDLGFNRKNVNFEYELNEVEAFLESKANRYSEHFFAGQLAWFLTLRTSICGGDQYLSVYLDATDRETETLFNVSDWSIKADYELLILNQSVGQNKSLSFASDFSKTTLNWGLDRKLCTKFISIRELRAGGFIRENKIRVRVCLKLVSNLIIPEKRLRVKSHLT